MFVQIIRARVQDPAGVEAAMERWRTELRPGALGFLGSTGGITPDGELVVAARFESEELARRNSERPEQGAWWAELERHLAAPASFQESSDVELLLGGGSDDAGFVQFVIGRVQDRDAARQAMAAGTEEMRRQRPDIIGGYTVWHDQHRFTDVVYFRSEREARQAEAEMSSEMRATLDKATMKLEEFLDVGKPLTS